MKNYTAKELKAFEIEMGDCFRNKLIRAPIHLADGQEEKMINVFQKVKDEDWVFCSWRSHYQCLLKGVPREEVKQAILDCRSISLCFPAHRVFSSAIVAGNVPIATGVAFDIKRRKLPGKVWCWLGEMSSETGTFNENWKYAVAQNLPITYVIEDNFRSVCTDTRKTWNLPTLTYEQPELVEKNKVIYYTYRPVWPHSGMGERILF